MDEKLKLLLEKIKKVNKKVDEAFISRAYLYEKEAHTGQYRLSGEPYYNHPYQVAMILADLGMDDASVAAGLLHDVLEDTNITHEDMEKEFGIEVVELVEGVTKLGKIPYSSKEEQQIENLRKMFMAMAKDIRVIIIKLADRLHNMRTIKSLPDEKRRWKALETMEIYSPIAHRLGINNIKWELEDLSLMYLDPIAYEEISSQIAQKRSERIEALEVIKKTISEELDKVGIKATVDGRAKHFYSIYRKMYTKNKTLDSIYDLFAVRVIVDTIKDCYTVLGIAHELFNPMPGRFKDYISMPKKNMYQSLHSTVISQNGTPFEIQIRTWEMHKTAEYGIAAHWKYKEGIEGVSKDKDMESKLAWIRQLLEFQNDSENPNDFISNLKIDLFADEVFVFTPKGDVINLPLGSTSIDFAFSIHSQVGYKMVGAKVNGKIVPLDTSLNNGDVIEIITSGHTPGPSVDWLKIAKTGQARNKINAWFKKINRPENIEKGKEIIEKEFKKEGFDIADFKSEEMQSFVIRKLSYNHMDDFYAVLGSGGITLEKVMNRVKDYYNRKKPAVIDLNKITAVKGNKSSNSSGVTVKGIDNCLVKFAKCCNPVPGDKIIGYITRGRGVSVHRSDCVSIKNVEKTDGDRNRLIEVSWSGTESGTYNAEIIVVAVDRPGLLVDVTILINELKIPICAISARVNKEGKCVINATLQIDKGDMLSRVITKINTVKDVIFVSRTNK